MTQMTALITNPEALISLGNAFLVALPPTILALGTLIAAIRSNQKSDKIKGLVNGRMEQLLELAIAKALHEGKLIGHQEALDKVIPVIRDKGYNINDEETIG